MIRSFKARLNTSIFKAPRITWYDEDNAKYARIMAKAAMNNKKDGRAIYLLG